MHIAHTQRQLSQHYMVVTTITPNVLYVSLYILHKKLDLSKPAFSKSSQHRFHLEVLHLLLTAVILVIKIHTLTMYSYH